MPIFGSEKMLYERLEILEKDRDSVVVALQRLGVMDLRRCSLNLQSDSPDQMNTRIYSMIEKFDETLKALPPKKVVPEKQLGMDKLIEESEGEMGAAEAAAELIEQRRQILSEDTSVERHDYTEWMANREIRLRRIAEHLDRISAAHYSRMINLNEMLKIEYERQEAVNMFKTTGHVCVIEGWVPEKRLKDLRDVLHEATSERYNLEMVHVKELPPTYFSVSESPLIRSFENIINFYSTPRSDEINPAWLFMISFPVFFGLMVSDAGYGLLSWIFGYIIAKRTRKDTLVHDMAVIWQLAAIFTVLFGIINNQYFGFGLDQYIFPSFKGFDWSHNIQTVVIIALLVGLMQITFGLILGFINNYRKKRLRVAVSKLFLIALLLSGTVATTGYLFHIFSGLVSAVALCIVVACLVLILLVKPSQSGRIIDLVIYPISYIRIMGFGITSVIIGSLIDKVFTPNISSGIGIFIIYLFVFSLLHLLNLALSTFEGAMQGVRLNLVEFFEEFYTGGGVKYEPFRCKRVYTIE